MNTDPQTLDPTALRQVVKEKYGEAARTAQKGAASSCGCGCSSARDPITSDLYDAKETAGLPTEAVLGSGGGIDVLLSARRVGPTGKAYGLDMTDDMLALARENQRKAGVENVEFLKGEIEAIPLPGDAVDVIISNCVINLSADKRKVLSEAFRVLKPGGRFAVSDVVFRGEVPEAVKRSVELWIGCVAGALQETEYRSLLAEVGFAEIEVEPTRIYRAEDAKSFLQDAGIDPSGVEEVDGKVMSAFVRARKPR